jgi:hypothetical protein
MQQEEPEPTESVQIETFTKLPETEAEDDYIKRDTVGPLESERALTIKRWLKNCCKFELNLKQRLIFKKWIYRMFYMLIMICGLITDKTHGNAFIGVGISCFSVWTFIWVVELIQWAREVIWLYPVGPLLWIHRKEKFVSLLPD